MSGVDSELFPTEKVAGSMDPDTRDVTPGTLNASDLDGFLSIRGDHALRDSQAKYVEGWLSALENKQRAKEKRA